MMFTGNMIDGRKAAEWGLANGAVPLADLEDATMRLVQRIAGVPRGHLAMHKMVVNQAMLTMGLEQTQFLATIFDGIARHNPEGMWFRRYAQHHGFKAAIEWRDSGRPSALTMLSLFGTNVANSSSRRPCCFSDGRLRGMAAGLACGRGCHRDWEAPVLRSGRPTNRERQPVPYADVSKGLLQAVGRC